MASSLRPLWGRLFTALTASMLLLAFGAQAACPSDDEWKKVLFAQPRVHPDLVAGGVDVPTLMSNVQAAFDLERERRWVEREADPISFLLCDQMSDLSPAVWLQRVDELHRRRVVLEIDPTFLRGDGGQSEAQLRYGLVAAGVGFNEGSSGVHGIFAARMRLPRVDAIIQAFVNPLEVDAYIAIGLGVVYLEDGMHDLAYSNLCRGLAQLGSLPSPEVLPPTQRQLDALKQLEAFGHARLDEAIQAGLGKPTGATLTFFAEQRGDAFHSDPCGQEANND